MEQWLSTTITIVCAVLASSGFWAFLQTRREKKSASNRMLLALAHDRILYLGGIYISRGYITTDEYENLYDFLFQSYKRLGGNGSAEHIVGVCGTLPIRNNVNS